jgi:hypothetical protein
MLTHAQTLVQFEIHKVYNEAKIDWKNDVKGQDVMSKDVFHSSLFEVADMWTTTPLKVSAFRFK